MTRGLGDERSLDSDALVFYCQPSCHWKGRREYLPIYIHTAVGSMLAASRFYVLLASFNPLQWRYSNQSQNCYLVKNHCFCQRVALALLLLCHFINQWQPPTKIVRQPQRDLRGRLIAPISPAVAESKHISPPTLPHLSIFFWPVII